MAVRPFFTSPRGSLPARAESRWLKHKVVISKKVLHLWCTYEDLTIIVGIRRDSYLRDTLHMEAFT